MGLVWERAVDEDMYMSVYIVCVVYRKIDHVYNAI